MTRFVLIRHGQTVWHSDGVERAEGRAEVDLDEVGGRQARATAARLNPWEISAVYSSPLKRAFSTASILAARRGLAVQPEPGLIDIDYGKWHRMLVFPMHPRFLSSLLSAPSAAGPLFSKACDPWLRTPPCYNEPHKTKEAIP